MCEALNRDYQICDEIGRGRFGAVHRCVSRESNQPFAVKSISKKSISNDSIDSQCLLYEPKILSLVSPHPNIVQIFNLYEDEDNLHMILELCRPNHDLFNLIATNGRLTEKTSRPIMSQLMSAIDHVHKCGVAHRDIKPDNIFFDLDNNVKVGDFGSAVVVYDEERMMGGCCSGVVGTPYYVAPEVLSGMEYNGEKADVWSAGVVLYIMIAGFPPFYGDSAVEVFEAVRRGNLRFPSRVFGFCSKEVKDLIRRMLCKDVHRRFSADQVLSHPWMTKSGESDDNDPS
ncbi:hypothetical protein ACFE04_007976 [Oxalis oulophora]